MDSSEQLINCQYVHDDIKCHWEEIIQENDEMQRNYNKTKEIIF